MRHGSGLVVVAATAITVALGVETSRLAAANPAAALGGGAGWEGVLQVGAAAATTAAGIVVALNRRAKLCGGLLALTGLAILVTQVPVQDAGSAPLFTVALAGGSVAASLAGTAALACPVAPLRGIDRGLIVLSLVTTLLIRGLFPTAVFDPPANGCYGCPRNLLDVRSDPSLYTGLMRWGLILTIVWGAAVAVRAAWRWERAARVVRLVNAPLVLGGAGISALAATTAIDLLRSPTLEIDEWLRIYWLTQVGLATAMAGGVLASGLRARRLAGRVAEGVLAAVPDAATLQATLAASIDDPELLVIFPRGDGTVVDADGRQVPSADRTVPAVRVIRAETVVAEVRYGARMAGVSHQLVAAVGAAGLAIENVAARARLLAEVGDLAASRRRIVEAADAERRRLERDLHDGAQQRLIALQIRLQMAAGPGTSSNHRDTYTLARHEVGTALDELRDLAHGIHPLALSDGGLGIGLRTLAETSPVPLLVDAAGVGRYEAVIESAAYRLVAETVRTAGKSSERGAVTVTLRNPGHSLRVRVTAQGLGRGIGEEIVARAGDRITALDGSVTFTTAGETTTIEGSIPCAS
jgi:signal transduction histidine kinase